MHIMSRSAHNTCVSVIYVHSPFWKGILVKHWDCYMELMEEVSTAMFPNFTSSLVVAWYWNQTIIILSCHYHMTHTVHSLICTAGTHTESIIWYVIKECFYNKTVILYYYIHQLISIIIYSITYIGQQSQVLNPWSILPLRWFTSWGSTIPYTSHLPHTMHTNLSVPVTHASHLDRTIVCNSLYEVYIHKEVIRLNRINFVLQCRHTYSIYY